MASDLKTRRLQIMVSSTSGLVMISDLIALSAATISTVTFNVPIIVFSSAASQTKKKLVMVHATLCGICEKPIISPENRTDESLCSIISVL